MRSFKRSDVAAATPSTCRKARSIRRYIGWKRWACYPAAGSTATRGGSGASIRSLRAVAAPSPIIGRYGIVLLTQYVDCWGRPTMWSHSPIADYAAALSRELAFDGPLSRRVRDEVEDHLWEAAASEPDQ